MIILHVWCVNEICRIATHKNYFPICFIHLAFTDFRLKRLCIKCSRFHFDFWISYHRYTLQLGTISRAVLARPRHSWILEGPYQHLDMSLVKTKNYIALISLKVCDKNKISNNDSSCEATTQTNKHVYLQLFTWIVDIGYINACRCTLCLFVDPMSFERKLFQEISFYNRSIFFPLIFILT